MVLSLSTASNNKKWAQKCTSAVDGGKGGTLSKHFQCQVWQQTQSPVYRRICIYMTMQPITPVICITAKPAKTDSHLALIPCLSIIMLRATAPLQSSPSLLDRLSIRVITQEQDINTLRQLNSTIFPITYHDRFYKDLTAACGDLSCRAVFIIVDEKDIIGTFSCRFEAPPQQAIEVDSGVTRCTYVMTFGLLAKYRMRGVGEWMWQRLLEMYAQSTKLMVLHVQCGNLAALRFYKRRGFVEQCIVKDYYRRLTPPDAVLLLWWNADHFG